jgi:fructokinase
MDNNLYGGIEAGGTKFICAVGTAPDNIIAQARIPTTSPEETLDNVVSFFKSQAVIKALGVVSFGPLDLDKKSPTYGFVTSTPKEGWNNTNLLGILSDELNVPVIINTDVNGSALAEHEYGAGKGLSSIAYMTVGTGIGVGSISNDEFSVGPMHLEMGHMMIPRHPDDKEFASNCSYHDSCLEGLASGPALQKRWGVEPRNLNDEKAWEIEAYYLAVGLVNVITCTIPMRIIIGGGVMNHSGLIDAVRLKIPEILNGYLQIPQIVSNIKDYIVSPELGVMSGVFGGLKLASKNI